MNAVPAAPAPPEPASSRRSAAGGGCKTVGFSCENDADCCDAATNTECESLSGGPGKRCCVQENKPGCTIDKDCCSDNVCIAGTCEDV